ncbi:S-adenosyl-L-methionine-dependent methyltransferases superfamily protein [Tanacetum coccineum]|uniref:S-adenosyl-L-methionine-dependent methyltransferases superfamily protein n=1 Tax=Tanacetum coccineum TaxID=301880 RepID=A0ABQ5DRY4_9ASTR
MRIIPTSYHNIRSHPPPSLVHFHVEKSRGGQAVMALRKMGVVDVTGFEVVESLPLVGRGDPHHLEFFDGVFGFVFSANLDQALFKEKCVKEMERCVRDGGVIAVCVDSEVKEVVELFRMSRFLLAENVTLLCGGQAVKALREIGVVDVTGVEVVEPFAS